MAADIFSLFSLLNFHSARENYWCWQLLPAQSKEPFSPFFPATLLLLQQEELQEQGAKSSQTYTKEKYLGSFVSRVPLCLRYCTTGQIQDIFERLIYLSTDLFFILQGVKGLSSN